jgi:hypothetical protein
VQRSAEDVVRCAQLGVDERTHGEVGHRPMMPTGGYRARPSFYLSLGGPTS